MKKWARAKHLGKKKPQVLQLGAESTFEGGGDKPLVYTFSVALQHLSDNWASDHRRENMECTVSWTGHSGTRSGMGFVAETGSGHVVAMDGAPDAAKPENGGQNLAPRPMEMLLAGTGGCTAYDVVLILKRGRHDVRGCSVKIVSERASEDPKVFTHINMHFTVTGKGVPAAAVERAIAMSHDKYCSASIMLGKTAEITTSFELVEA
jgi:putative redox protein